MSQIPSTEAARTLFSPYLNKLVWVTRTATGSPNSAVKGVLKNVNAFALTISLGDFPLVTS